MSAVQPRNLAPLLKWIRQKLLGREYKNYLRFQDFVATRSPPPPNLPEGVSHKLYGNYYYTRDGRHLTGPPVLLVENAKTKALASGVKENATATAISAKKIGHITPGKPYHWEPPSHQSAK